MLKDAEKKQSDFEEMKKKIKAVQRELEQGTPQQWMDLKIKVTKNWEETGRRSLEINLFIAFVGLSNFIGRVSSNGTV